MNIESVFSNPLTAVNQESVAQRAGSTEAQQKFKSFLKDAINQTNQAQIESDIMTDKLIRGEQVELHDVMITAQKASITLNTTMEVRNKVIEAYQEIIRMQV